jgi:ABC-2 type transport system permease protein
MDKIIEIARNDLRLIFKEKDIWINLVVIPLVLAYVIGIANGALGSGGAQTPTILIDVIDEDNSALSAEFLSAVRAAYPGFVLCPLDQTEDDACRLDEQPLTPELARTRLEDKISLAELEIPAGFESQINAGDSVTVVYRSNETASAPSYILQAVQSAAQRMGGALAAARVGSDVAVTLDAGKFEDDPAFGADVRERAADVWATDPITVQDVVSRTEEENTTTPTQSGFGQSIPGMASMYVMFAIFPAVGAILLERKQWTLQRLTTMPISRAQILGGKLLARFLIGMIQYAIVFGFGVFLGVRYGNDLLALALLMVSFVLCITALTLALTTLIKNPAQANGVTLFMTLTLAPLGGAWWSLEIVPAWMRTFGHISPVAWVMDGYTSLLFYGGSLGTVIAPILVLLAMTAVFFGFGVLRFKFD